MPSFPHELLVDMFRSQSELAPALLRLCVGLSLDHARAEVGSIDLSQVASTEYRADAVVVLRDPAGAAVAAIVIEVQLRVDAAKRLTWPVYLAALRAKHGCPVVLLVLAPDPAVARWARAPIPLGHPGFLLEPIAITFDDLPRHLDPTEAHLPELAVLAALAHPALHRATLAVAALADLHDDRARLYFDLILAALPPHDRQTLEARMQGYEYQSDFARKYYAQGREQGLEQGREQGREQGLEQGHEQGLRDAALALLRAKLEGVTAQDLAAVAALRSEAALTDLIGALGRATTAAQLRAALATAIAG